MTLVSHFLDESQNTGCPLRPLHLLRHPDRCRQALHHLYCSAEDFAGEYFADNHHTRFSIAVELAISSDMKPNS